MIGWWNMAHLNKEISLFGGIAMLLTTLLGTGAFVVPALAATIAQEQSLWGWIFMFIVMLPIAVVFGLLGARYPHEGGTAYLLSLTLGTRFERVCGWMFMSLIPIGLPAAVAISVGYLSSFLGLGSEFEIILSVLVLLAIGAINIFGVKSASNVQGLIAALVVTSLIVVLLFSHVNVKDFVPVELDASKLSIVTSSMAVILWCFMGIEAMLHMGAEFKQPKRDFPLTIIFALILSSVFYYAVAVMVVSYGSYGDEFTDKQSIALIANSVFGVLGAKLVGFIGFIAAFASMNLYTMSFSRMVMSMSQNKQLPSVFKHVNKRGSPFAATVLVIGLGLLTILSKNILNLSLDKMIGYADGVFAFIYLFAMISGIRLLKKTRFVAYVGSISMIFVLYAMKDHLYYALIIFCVFYFVDRYIWKNNNQIQAAL